MKPPNAFPRKSSRAFSYSCCWSACQKWLRFTVLFYHEGKHWWLCEEDFDDYWYNTDVLEKDYKWYG